MTSWGSSWGLSWGDSWGSIPVDLVINGRWIKEEAFLRERRHHIKPETPFDQRPKVHVVDEVRKAAAHMSSLGGIARAQSLTSTQRTTIARNAANTRWR